MLLWGIGLTILMLGAVIPLTIIHNKKKKIANEGLLDKLKRMCNPANFIKQYDKDKVEKANAIYQQLMSNNLDNEKLMELQAQAVAELGVKSPLRHCELYKEEIRELSKQLELPTWNKQSFACLASRFVYGEEINEKKLAMVDKAEQALLDAGFKQLRVRIHGENLARIEVMPAELERLLSMREAITEKLREAGFAYITMDLQGYRTGAMNEALKLTTLNNK